MSGIQKNIFSRKVYDGHTLKAEKKIVVSSNTTNKQHFFTDCT